MSAEMSGADRFVHATEFLDLAIEDLDKLGSTDPLALAQLEATIANTQATLALCELVALTVPTMVTRGGMFRLRHVVSWRKLLGL